MSATDKIKNTIGDVAGKAKEAFRFRRCQTSVRSDGLAAPVPRLATVSSTRPRSIGAVSTELRFGIGVRGAKSHQRFIETARRFEDFGFDVYNVADHLGGPAPFPVLAAAAQVTSRIRLGTYVLNAAFYSPALLARDAADVDLLSNGRLILGLGAGYVREEFELAEIPFPTAGQRVRHLQHVTEFLKADHPSIPILIAGNGDRVLAVAARHADIIGLTGSDAGKNAEDALAGRISHVRQEAGHRFDTLELDLAITACPTDDSGRADLSMIRRYAPELSDEELLALPAALAGTPRDIADKIRLLHDTYGITSFSLQHHHAEYFARVIAELR